LRETDFLLKKNWRMDSNPSRLWTRVTWRRLY